MSKLFHKTVYDLYVNKEFIIKKCNDIFLPCSSGFNVIGSIKVNGNKGVYILSDGKEKRIAKVVELYNIANEIDLMEYMSKIGISPMIYKTDIFEKNGEEFAYFEMEMMSGTLEDLLKFELEYSDLDIILRLVLSLLRAMYEYKICHGDYHWKNIGVKYDDKKKKIDLMVLDFEFGEFKKNDRLDMIQLIRSLDKRYSNMNDKNMIYLRNKLINIYNKNFNDNIQESDIEKEFQKYKSI